MDKLVRTTPARTRLRNQSFSLAFTHIEIIVKGAAILDRSKLSALHHCLYHHKNTIFVQMLYSLPKFKVGRTVELNFLYRWICRFL